MKILEVGRKQKRIKVLIEDTDDLWVLRTMLGKGDRVEALTTRDVKVSDTGEAERRPMRLEIEVADVEFQPFSGNLRVRGRITRGPDRYGLKGHWHTIALKPGMEVEIEKSDGWSSRMLERLNARTGRGKALIVAVDYDEYAIALAGAQGIKILYEGDMYLPGKDDPRRQEELRGYTTMLAKTVTDALSRVDGVKIIAVVGPGFLKEEVAEKLREALSGYTIVVDDASMGGRKGVEEALRRDKLRRTLGELALARAEKILEEFHRLLAKDPDRVAFTLDDVLAVVRMGAAAQVLLLDEMLFSYDEEERGKAQEILENAGKTGVEYMIVPMESPAGHMIWQMGGAVAILRYPLPRDARMI